MLGLTGIFTFSFLLRNVHSLILHCLKALLEVDNFVNLWFLFNLQTDVESMRQC